MEKLGWWDPEAIYETTSNNRKIIKWNNMDFESEPASQIRQWNNLRFGVEPTTPLIITIPEEERFPLLYQALSKDAQDLSIEITTIVPSLKNLRFPPLKNHHSNTRQS